RSLHQVIGPRLGRSEVVMLLQVFLGQVVEEPQALVGASVTRPDGPSPRENPPEREAGGEAGSRKMHEESSLFGFSRRKQARGVRLQHWQRRAFWPLASAEGKPKTNGTPTCHYDVLPPLQA